MRHKMALALVAYNEWKFSNSITEQSLRWTPQIIETANDWSEEKTKITKLER